MEAERYTSLKTEDRENKGRREERSKDICDEEVFVKA